MVAVAEDRRGLQRVQVLCASRAPGLRSQNVAVRSRQAACFDSSRVRSLALWGRMIEVEAIAVL